MEQLGQLEQLSYDNFLRNKIQLSLLKGLECTSDYSQFLKPHQMDIFKWALSHGRGLIAASFGLGKTRIEIALMSEIYRHTGMKTLIVCPLGVKHQFTEEDGKKMGVQFQYVRNDNEAEKADTPFLITNYERVREGNITPGYLSSKIGGCSLDEGSVLRSLGSDTQLTFTEVMKPIPYRFVATATPSPNNYRELIYYAEYLGIMDHGQCLTRWFKRDSQHAGNLTLHPHLEKEFWLWVSSWALFIERPSDLGHSDEGYMMPPMKVIWHKIASDHSKAWGLKDSWGQSKLFMDSAASIGDSIKEKRNSLLARVKKLRNIILSGSGGISEQWIIWCHLNDEQKKIDIILKEIGLSVSSVFGALTIEQTEQRLYEWLNKKTDVLLSKPEMLGSGCNLQQCHKVIFVGIRYQFEEMIQAIHRVWRYLQDKEVEIHIIYTDAESHVKSVLLQKWENHKLLLSKMTEIVKKYGLVDEALKLTLQRSIGTDREEVKGKDWILVKNDCVDEMKKIPDNSVHLIHTSIPFGNHYEYSPCYDDKTEVLTRRGWLSFGEIIKSDMLGTVNIEDEYPYMEWQSPSEITWKPYVGKMIKFFNRKNFDLLVTLNHKLCLASRVGHQRYRRISKIGKWGLLEASKIICSFPNGPQVFRKWRMMNTGKIKTGNSPTDIKIPYIRPGSRGPFPKDISKIKADDFVRLIGWYLSEGCCRANGSKAQGEVIITQSLNHAAYRDEIKSLLERIGLNVGKCPNKEIRVSNVPLARFLVSQFGLGSYSKHIPRWVKDLHPDLLTILRDTMMKGDGNKNGFAYTSCSPQLREDFQEICLFTGWRASICGNVVRIGSKQTLPEIRRRPELIDYCGMIGCATVPNHTLIVRRNGVPVVSGNSYNDFGHNPSDDAFWKQMDFLIPDLLRVLKPGRIAAIHAKDRLLYGHQNGLGTMSVGPFSDECVAAFRKHGFIFFGRITVVTDVVRENASTYRLGWSENCKDSTKMGVGMPEYVLLFRKRQTDISKAYADEPVTKSKEKYTRSQWQIDAHSFWRSSGDRLIKPEEVKEMDPEQFKGMEIAQVYRWFKQFSWNVIYDYEKHVKMGIPLEKEGRLPASFMTFAPEAPENVKNHDGSSVWTDVNFMKTLNTDQSRAHMENHVCPLSFDIVERIINRYSNAGEIVFDPFSGIGTVPLIALRMNRKGYGIELAWNYWRWGVRYLQEEEIKKRVPTLFDMEGIKKGG